MKRLIFSLIGILGLCLMSASAATKSDVKKHDVEWFKESLDKATTLGRLQFLRLRAQMSDDPEYTPQYQQCVWDGMYPQNSPCEECYRYEMSSWCEDDGNGCGFTVRHIKFECWKYAYLPPFSVRQDQTYETEFDEPDHNTPCNP